MSGCRSAWNRRCRKTEIWRHRYRYVPTYDGPVATVSFGLIHAQVGLLEEDLRIAKRGKTRCPNADAELYDRAGLRQKWCRGHRFQEHGGHAVNLRRRSDAIEEDDEFLASDPTQKVFWSQTFSQRLGNRLQGLIPGPMAETVVDGLEVVRVNEEHGAFGASTFAHALHEADTIIGPGHGIAQGRLYGGSMGGNQIAMQTIEFQMRAGEGGAGLFQPLQLIELNAAGWSGDGDRADDCHQETDTFHGATHLRNED